MNLIRHLFSGAVEFDTPLLQPREKNVHSVCNLLSVGLLDTAGCVVELPYDLRHGLSKFIARWPYKNPDGSVVSIYEKSVSMRRFHFGREFWRGLPGMQPIEHNVLCYDVVVTSSKGSALPEVEVVHMMIQTVFCFVVFFFLSVKLS